MSWNLNSDRPIYAQIIEKMQMDIASGIYEPGAKLPSVRELAAEAGVNPNTMQKALAELERQELVFSRRTSGRFVTEEAEKLEQLKTQLANEQIAAFLKGMQVLGFNKDETLRLIEKVLKGEK